MSPTEAAAFLRTNPLAFFESCVKILDKRSQLISPKANILQRRISEVYRRCIADGKPCRIIVLKPRQVGCSTFCALLDYLHLRNYSRQRGVVMADELANSDNLLAIINRFAETDKFPWCDDPPKVTAVEVTFSNGSFCDKDTANNPRAGISATRQLIHCSEVARFPTDGVRNAATTLTSMLNSLADIPQSLAIMESTAFGAQGAFFDYWQGAIDPNQEEGQGNGWVRIFAAWHEFEEHATPLPHANFIRDLDERERAGRERYGWTDEQIYWRRRTIAANCMGDPSRFDQDYPESPEVAFQASNRPRFYMPALVGMTEMAKEAEKTGYLTPAIGQSTKPTFVLAPRKSPEAWLEIWSPPERDRRFILAVDTATGRDQTKSENPDRHSAIVLQEQFFRESNGLFYPTSVVARLTKPCYVELDLLATQVHLLSAYYGNCMTVIEANNSGLALIKLLETQYPTTPLFTRSMVDSHTSKSRYAAGFVTDKNTRTLIISNLAAAIRDKTINIPDKHIIKELTTFVVDEKGHEAAMRGEHDDDVLALAIALYCLPSGTIYRDMRHLRFQADLQDSEDKKSMFT